LAEPGADALTEYAPAFVFAVKAVEVATPLEFVASVSEAMPLAKVPLAPDPGAVNVTITPLVGVPPVVTVATSVAANAAPTVALWEDPLVAAISTALLPEPPPQLISKPAVKQAKTSRIPPYTFRFMALSPLTWLANSCLLPTFPAGVYLSMSPRCKRRNRTCRKDQCAGNLLVSISQVKQKVITC